MNTTDFNYIAALLKERSGLIVTQEKNYLFETRLMPIARRNNLASLEAARIIAHIRPRVVIPCHYDMMMNNVGSPSMFRVALERLGAESEFVLMPYYEPWIYRRDPGVPANGGSN